MRRGLRLCHIDYLSKNISEHFVLFVTICMLIPPPFAHLPPLAHSSFPLLDLFLYFFVLVVEQVSLDGGDERGGVEGAVVEGGSVGGSGV